MIVDRQFVDAYLLARCLAVFKKFVLIFGEGVGPLVARLLIEHLRFKKVAHLRHAGIVVIAVQAQVLLGLFNASMGKWQRSRIPSNP